MLTTVTTFVLPIAGLAFGFIAGSYANLSLLRAVQNDRDELRRRLNRIIESETPTMAGTARKMVAFARGERI